MCLGFWERTIYSKISWEPCESNMLQKHRVAYLVHLGGVTILGEWMKWLYIAKMSWMSTIFQENGIGEIKIQTNGKSFRLTATISFHTRTRASLWATGEEEGFRDITSPHLDMLKYSASEQSLADSWKFSGNWSFLLRRKSRMYLKRTPSRSMKYFPCARGDEFPHQHLLQHAAAVTTLKYHGTWVSLTGKRFEFWRQNVVEHSGL